MEQALSASAPSGRRVRHLPETPRRRGRLAFGGRPGQAGGVAGGRRQGAEGGDVSAAEPWARGEAALGELGPPVGLSRRLVAQGARHPRHVRHWKGLDTAPAT